MGDVRPDVEEGKTIAQTLSSVQQPSDLIIRQLMNVIADQSNMIVDSCVVRLTRVEAELAEARSYFLKKRKRLPEETCFAFENLTQLWRIPQLPVQEWPDLSNARFKVCEPPLLVKRYAVRISSSCAKRPDLHDFPEEIVEQLIGVYLDGLRLGMRELSCPVSVAALRRNPTPIEVLAYAGQRRGKGGEFEERKKARARWTILVRGALQRALYNIGKYVLDAYRRLVPAPKVKIVRVGTEPRTRQRTPEDDNEEDDTAWRKD